MTVTWGLVNKEGIGGVYGLARTPSFWSQTMKLPEGSAECQVLGLRGVRDKTLFCTAARLATLREPSSARVQV